MFGITASIFSAVHFPKETKNAAAATHAAFVRVVRTIAGIMTKTGRWFVSGRFWQITIVAVDCIGNFEILTGKENSVTSL